MDELLPRPAHTTVVRTLHDYAAGNPQNNPRHKPPYNHRTNSNRVKARLSWPGREQRDFSISHAEKYVEYKKNLIIFSIHETLSL